MPLPQQITGFNKRYVNRLTRRLVGHAQLAEIEHVGRRSGRVYHTPIMAFRHGDTLTVALTYGPNVDWLKNISAAGHCTIRFEGETIQAGAPRPLSGAEGLARTPYPQRALLRWPIRCDDFIELPIRG